MTPDMKAARTACEKIISKGGPNVEIAQDRLKVALNDGRIDQTQYEELLNILKPKDTSGTSNEAQKDQV